MRNCGTTSSPAGCRRARGIHVQPQNCGGPISTAACIHLSFAAANFLIQEVFPVWPEDEPTRPGLGVEVNRDYLARGEAMRA